MLGQQLGHYRILEKIGAGGMGEVYRAHDEQLDRDVALKVLPAHTLTDEIARARLLREARAAAALNHPHICTIHEVGEAGGQAYIAMELVEGKPLSALVPGQGLPVETVLRFGSQIADALAHAHERRIVHRDLKSANVVITPEGRAKVLDFGLAKRISGEELAEGTTKSLASLTQAGALIGTVPYMAPEQLRGQPADARSDVWALGVVLYEMVAGARPFQGQTSFELSSAILNQLPPPLPPAVPTQLGAVIERCLAKEPGQRYQQGSEVRAALEAVQSGAALPAWPAWRYALSRRRWLVLTAAVPILAAILVGLNVGGLRERLRGGAPRIRSLAVLPLENLSGDKEQDYFADGMTEELITNLAKISALKVISRTSMMQYKGTKKPLPQIAKELNVDALIEGSVLREGGQVRITAQLIQASTDQHLWAESYQRDLRGVLALQGEIASAIADKVRAALTPSERNRLASARPVNPEAYEAYLKGMQHWYKLTRQDIDTALEYFELALKKDPNYAPAHSGVALVWIGRQQMGYTPPREAGPKAKAAALKAVELDSTLAQAHSSLANVNYNYEWDWAGAEAEFKRAIELNPSYPDTRALYSQYLMIMKRPEEGMAEIQRALELDPLNPFFPAIRASDLEFAGRYDEAIVQFRKALRTSPELPFAHWLLSGILFRKAMYEESLAEMKAYYAGDREMEEALTQGYAQSGYRGVMRRAADTLAARARKTYVGPIDVAALYVGAGESAQALAWLEKSLEVHDGNTLFVNVLAPFESLRNTPRFQALLRRMNFPP
jgi:TolB-like protein/Tfp pilus assembly protein PilF